MTVPAEVVAPAIGQILETMYFCESFYRGKGRVREPHIGTSITFTGAVSGVFNLEVSSALAARLAADFLATEPPDPGKEQIEATVSELANIACGATIGAWQPCSNVHFSVPHPLSDGDGAGEAEFTHCFSVNGENPEIAIEIAVSDSRE